MSGGGDRLLGLAAGESKVDCTSGRYPDQRGHTVRPAAGAAGRSGRMSGGGDRLSGLAAGESKVDCTSGRYPDQRGHTVRPAAGAAGRSGRMSGGGDRLLGLAEVRFVDDENCTPEEIRISVLTLAAARLQALQEGAGV
ncbi:hypothetical protein J2T17_007724 [Paenibacillus mucilaginosus]|uniref:hypothetical protein n=1 Tax=Paenibacillus mucilaginosus TaxID=61624 RepID=UPI003D1DF105